MTDHADALAQTDCQVAYVVMVGNRPMHVFTSSREAEFAAFGLRKEGAVIRLCTFKSPRVTSYTAVKAQPAGGEGEADPLLQAAAWFDDYEAQHRAKMTPEGNAKAAVNAERAEFCRRAAIRSAMLSGGEGEWVMAKPAPQRRQPMQPSERMRGAVRAAIPVYERGWWQDSQLDDIAKAVLDAAPPSGWVMAPRELTDAMLTAAQEEHGEFCWASGMWKTLLAAAPQAPAAPPAIEAQWRPIRLDEGVLQEAVERASRDMGRSLMEPLSPPLANIIGRHMAHHIVDVQREFAEREVWSQVFCPHRSQ